METGLVVERFKALGVGRWAMLVKRELIKRELMVVGRSQLVGGTQQSEVDG